MSIGAKFETSIEFLLQHFRPLGIKQVPVDDASGGGDGRQTFVSLRNERLEKKDLKKIQ